MQQAVASMKKSIAMERQERIEKTSIYYEDRKFEQNLPAVGKNHEFYTKMFLYVFYFLSFVFEFDATCFSMYFVKNWSMKTT